MKKVNLAYLFVLWLFLIFSNCQKEDETKASCKNCGYVKEFFTNKPIPFAKVEIHQNINYNSLIESVTADSNGKFVTETNLYNVAGILITAPNHLPYFYSLWQTNSDRETNTYWLDQPGYIQVHVKNTNPFDENDRVRLPDFNFKNDVEIHGTDVDTTICCLLGAAYKKLPFGVFVRKNFIDTSYGYYPIVEPNQTITVDVNY